MTRRVLLVWEQGGNLGHLGRLLPLAQALRAKGVAVQFAVADSAAAARYLAPEGFDCLAVPQRPKFVAQSLAMNQADVMLRSGFGLPKGLLAAHVRRWQELFFAVGASAAVVDASPVALYAARSAGLHAIALGHGFEIPTFASPGPCFAPWLPQAEAQASQCERELRVALEQLAAELGQPAAPRALADLYPLSQTALCTWPELDHFERQAHHAPYIGPIWGQLAGYQPHAFAPRAGPKVLAYLNIVDKRYDLLWQALVKHGANVLVASPAGNPRAAEAARGWGIDVVEHGLVLGPLLDNCDAVVTNGGIGVCSMALQAGKRLLLLPEHVEQGILANRLSGRGLAWATVRWRDKANMANRAENLLHADVSAEVPDFAARHAAYSPADAVGRLVFHLFPNDLQ